MRRAFLPFALLSFASIAWSLYLVFLYAPNERMMGAMQRLLYWHAGSATACYLAVGVIFFGAAGYFFSGKLFFDRLVQAGTEVGFVFASITLATGMIWGDAAWNTPFRFEPRLVSMLILWLMLGGGILLRILAPTRKRPSFCAALGIFSTVMVPIVIFSIKLLPHATQIHPEVVGDGGLKDPRFTHAFLGSMAALSVLTFFFIAFSIWIRSVEDKIRGTSA